MHRELKTYIGDDLQGYFVNPQRAREVASELVAELGILRGPSLKAKQLGNIGSIYLHLRELDKAQEYLGQSLDLINENGLGPNLLAQQSIRLANAL